MNVEHGKCMAMSYGEHYDLEQPLIMLVSIRTLD